MAELLIGTPPLLFWHPPETTASKGRPIQKNVPVQMRPAFTAVSFQGGQESCPAIHGQGLIFLSDGE
jgi:hypothetical protein